MPCPSPPPSVDLAQEIYDYGGSLTGPEFSAILPYLTENSKLCIQRQGLRRFAKSHPRLFTVVGTSNDYEITVDSGEITARRLAKLLVKAGGSVLASKWREVEGLDDRILDV
eukprot:539222-Amorphochlora_amoeboformis.AAC.1